MDTQDNQRIMPDPDRPLEAYLFDFNRLIYNDKHRTKEEAWLAGARIFLRQFNGGFCRNKTKTEEDTLDYFVSSGLEKTKEDAEKTIDLLKDKLIRYSSLMGTNFFKLETVYNSHNEKGYRLSLYSQMNGDI